MNKHTLLLSPLLFIIFISSCEKSNPVSNGSTNEIIPLKVGNAWTSTFSDYDSNGVITTAYIDSVWVAKDTIVDDQNYFLMFRQSENAVGPPYPQTSSYLARNTPSGYNEREVRFNLEGMAYNYPYHINDSTIVATNEAITVPAGTYNCIVYKFPAAEVLVDTVYQVAYGKSYICPNIGIVKQEFWYPQNRLIYRSVLTHVILNDK
jgi:hypothetical protein